MPDRDMFNLTRAIKELTHEVSVLRKMFKSSPLVTPPVFHMNLPQPAAQMPEGDIPIIDGEAIIDETRTVVVYKDQEYLKPCGEFVTSAGLGRNRTFCVKMAGHPSRIHEDRDGNTSDFGETYDEGTLAKTHAAIKGALQDLQYKSKTEDATQIISALQTAGILFRERI